MNEMEIAQSKGSLFPWVANCGDAALDERIHMVHSLLPYAIPLGRRRTGRFTGFFAGLFPE
jgi:hypothetical protein